MPHMGPLGLQGPNLITLVTREYTFTPEPYWNLIGMRENAMRERRHLLAVHHMNS